jgi:hypothetical protein
VSAPLATGTAWRLRRPLSMSALAALLAALAIGLAVLAPLLSLFGVAPGPLSAPQEPGREVAGIPTVYLPIYQAAAQRYHVSWALLAAIHRKETDFSRLRAPNARGDAVSSGFNGCGAAGPAQFGVVGVAPYHATVTSCPGSPSVGAGGTWRRYRDAAHGLRRPASYPQMAGQLPACAGTAPHGCVYDDVDALAAAESYLHDLGAGPELDQRAWNAARAYNGAGVYADVVLAWAHQYDEQATSALAPPAPGAQLLAAPVAGSRAVLRQDGLAAAPQDAPQAVRDAVAAANAISDRPYRLVHYPTHLDNPTYDCSSAVSHVLWGAGRLDEHPRDSTELMSYSQPGPGRWITVYANTGHTFVIVAGLRFDTARYDSGPNNAESGPRWRVGSRPTTNFVVRHPDGL